MIGIALGASIPFNQSMLICERLDVTIIKAKGLFFVLCKNSFCNHTYFGQEFYKPYIGNNPRELTTNDVSHAIRINILSEVIMVLFVMALYIVTLKQ